MTEMLGFIEACFNCRGCAISPDRTVFGVQVVAGHERVEGAVQLDRVGMHHARSRYFVHVTDIAAGLETALEPGTRDFRAVNLGRRLDVGVCFADISLARQELGYEPRVAFDEGMSELAEWLADQEAEDRVEEATAALVERGLAG
jgi:nucleoside-diphosphate-sugar epimerase